MEQIRDDPIISSMERTGYPPWYKTDGSEGYDPFDTDGDVFYGNQTEDF